MRLRSRQGRERRRRESFVSWTSSECQSHAELQRPRIANRSDLSERCRRRRWVRTRPEVRVPRDGVGPVRHIESLDKSLDANAPGDLELAAHPQVETEEVAADAGVA